MIIELGKKVRDDITGFKGIAVAKVEYLDKRVEIKIQPYGLKKSGEPKKPLWIPASQIVEYDW